MSQVVEIIVKDKIGPYRKGQIVELEDGVLLRALILGGKADVINPPDWELDKVLELEKEEFLYTKKVELVEEPLVETISELTIDTKTEEVKAGVKGNSKQNTDRKTPSSQPRRGRGS